MNTKDMSERSMDRLTKFRGKRADNGEWVYGDLIENQGRYFIYHATSENTIEDNDDGCITVAAIEVTANSVGQYTGIKDKNGKDIYEGDLVYIYWFEDYEDKSLKGIVKWNNAALKILIHGKDVDYFNTFEGDPTTSYEVIGDVHDKANQNQEWITPSMGVYSVHEVSDSPQFIPSPRLSVAMSVMQGLLSNLTWMSNEAKAALEKTGGNEKEGGKLLMKKIVSDSLELTDEFLAQISQGK